MPRRARNMSASNYIHIIVRGIGKQLLFEDDHDYRYYDNPLPFMDLTAIRNLLGDFGQYKEFIEKNDDDQGLEYSETRHSDAWAKEELARCLGITSGTALQKYSKIERDVALVKLKERGLSVRQISRLTGIGRNVVQKAGKNIKNESKEPSL